MQHSLLVTGVCEDDEMPEISGIKTEKNIGTITFKTDSDEDMKRLKRALAGTLTALIIEQYEGSYINAYITQEHSYLNRSEQNRVCKEVQRQIGEAVPNRRAHHLETKLYDFLQETNLFSIEGFTQFRLREYRAMLKESIDTAVNTLLAEQEYEDFIHLLQYYVESQEQREATVHVIFGDNDTFHMLNADKEEITKRCVEDFLTGKELEDITDDDLLLSALITLAPLEVVMHRPTKPRHKEMYDTIRRVFGERVSACTKCPICELFH